MSELSHQQQQQQQQQQHPQQQYTPNSSSSSGGGTAENPVDLSNSRPPPTHDQRGANGLLHESSK